VQSQSSNKRDVAVQCLEALLPRPEIRKAVWANSNIVMGLVEILQRKPGPQMSYQLGFCFWLLSFEKDIAEQINKCDCVLSAHDRTANLDLTRRYDVIPLFVDVSKAAVKEKVIRVYIATLRVRTTRRRVISFLILQPESCHQSTLSEPTCDASVRTSTVLQ